MVAATDVYGCPGCGKCGTELSFEQRGKKSRLKDHMKTCCPEQFDIMSTGDLCNMICKQGHAQCEGSGHTFEIYEERRMLQEEEKRLRVEAEAEAEAEALKPSKWTAYDKRHERS
jgi:hypothetical protein